MLESDYFWHRAHCHIKDIPDPRDPNLQRYAILVSLLESMGEAYNRKIIMGLRRGVGMTNKEQEKAFRADPNMLFEEVPSWASFVSPIDEWTSFLRDRAIRKYSAPFYKRFIFANPRCRGGTGSISLHDATTRPAGGTSTRDTRWTIATIATFLYLRSQRLSFSSRFVHLSGQGAQDQGVTAPPARLGRLRTLLPAPIACAILFRSGKTYRRLSSGNVEGGGDSAATARTTIGTCRAPAC